jgi:hypothetical protein
MTDIVDLSPLWGDNCTAAAPYSEEQGIHFQACECHGHGGRYFKQGDFLKPLKLHHVDSCLAYMI